MEMSVVVMLSLLLCFVNGNMFSSSTQGSLNTDIKELEITNIRSHVNVLKDNYHDLLKRVIDNENTIEFLKKGKQYLTNEIENLRRQLSCEIEAISTCFLENQTSDESFTECVNKTEVVSVCTFESKVEENCVFYNDESGLDKKNWWRNSGGTSTGNTGPSRAMAGNYYMYIESGFMGYLENALLVSNSLQPDAKLCLSFYYHMYGSDIGTLEVMVSSLGTSQTIFTRSGDQGNQWYHKKLYIQPASNLQIMFNGIVDEMYCVFGDIALDNIMLFTGECGTEINEASTQTTPP
ncbi:unnamed protein product [Mytilus coruscus]|uniref:MAM domain-containing protein n=1 Tax=Mytilus coruscus TaxID=42192 RepID=A0A6J8EP26_MYTCO|nr:unnamed protein product [Mytilus coruscus]